MKAIENNLILGELIRKERKKQKLTQEALAALSGVGVRFVRELERGKESCRLGLVLQVMQTLGITIYLASREDYSR